MYIYMYICIYIFYTCLYVLIRSFARITYEFANFEMTLQHVVRKSCDLFCNKDLIMRSWLNHRYLTTYIRSFVSFSFSFYS